MAVVAKLGNGKQHPRGPRRLRAIRPLPTLMTLGNLLCGFAAIHYGLKAMYDFGSNAAGVLPVTGNTALLERMLPSFISVGAGLIIVGMLFDGLDGVLARVTRNTTDFGGQLDSLADMVTCGVAPAILMIAFMHQQLHALGVNLSPLSSDIMGRALWVSAAVYVACAAMRLARFNVEHADVEYDPAKFRGLPSPGAAAMVVAVLIFFEQMREGGVALPGDVVLGTVPVNFVVYLMPVLALGTGLAMVSRIRYRKVSTLLRNRQPFGKVVVLLLVFAVFWAFKALVLVVLACGYGLSGPTVHAYRRLRRKPARRTAHPATPDQAARPDDQQTA